jgi:hypothetical protein
VKCSAESTCGAVSSAPTFLAAQIHNFKNEKRGQRRTWEEEIPAEIGVSAASTQK